MNDDLILKMILDESGFNAGMNSAQRKLGSFDGTVSDSGRKGGSKLGSIWTSFVGNFAAAGAMKVVSAVTSGIMELGTELSNNSATWKTFNGNMQNLGKSKGEIAAVKKELQSFAEQTIYSASDMATTYSQLEAVGIKSSDQLVKGFGGLAAAAEDPTQAMKTLSQQATQMAAKPMVQWQDFKLMLEQTPAGIAAVAKTMGMSTSDMVKGVQDGKIATQDFFDAITKTGTNDTFGKMATQYKTVGQAMDGLKETLTGKLQPAYDRVSKVAIDGISKVVDEVSKMDIDAIIEKVKSAVGVAKEFAPVISGIIGVMVALKALKTFTTIVSGVQKAVTAVKGLKTAFGVLKFAIAAAGGPVTIIIAAIGALVGVITYLWTTNEDFRAAVTNIWNGIKDTFVNAGKAIKKAWGGMKEWFGNLWDGIKEKSSNAAESTKNGWSNTKQWFKNTWNDIKNGAKGMFDSAVDSAKSSSKSAKSVWSGTKQWFSETWQNLKDSASEKWSAISNTVMEFVGPLVNGIKTAFSNMTNFISILWTNLITIGSSAFEILKNVILAPILFVTSMITGGWSEARDNMFAVWLNIQENALVIWNAIKSTLVGYFSAIYNSALSIWTGIKTTVVNVWNELLGQATLIWLNIKYFFINLWIDIKYGAIQKWIEIKYGVIQTWLDLKSNATTTWNNIKQFFVNTWNAIKSTASNTWNSIKSTMINTWNSIKSNFWNIVNGIVQSAENAWTNLKNGVSNTVDRVKNIFDSLRNINLLDVGRNIIQGLIDGITEKANAVVQKVQSIAGSIKKSITNALDIHSPSRWMRDTVGKNIVQGIIVGLDSEQSKLDQSMSDLVMTPSVKPTVRAISETPAISAAGTSSRNNQAAQTNEIHLHLNVYGDLPDTMIRQIAKKLKTELTNQMQRDADAVGGTLYAN